MRGLSALLVASSAWVRTPLVGVGPRTRASIVSLSTGESGESGESKAEQAAAAAALERLLSLEVEPIEAANATAGAAFRFEPQAAARGGGASAPVEDDIANGLGEIADIGGRGVGLLTLGLEIGLGGLLSPFGLASFVLFALLMNIGEFGDSPYRFAAYAPTAAEGDYYRPRDFEYAPELPAPWADQVDESDAPPASGLRTRPPVMSVGGGGAGPRHHRRRSFAHGIAAFGMACCTGLPAGALPAECYNGVMEQRQFLGQFLERPQELHPSWRQQHHQQCLDWQQPYLQQYLQQRQD